MTYKIETFTKAIHMYLEANSWPSFLSWWIISSLLGFRARIKKVGGGSCIGFESSILSYLDRVVISSRQSRTKSSEEREPYTQKQPKRIKRRIPLLHVRSVNQIISSSKSLFTVYYVACACRTYYSPVMLMGQLQACKNKAKSIKNHLHVHVINCSSWEWVMTRNTLRVNFITWTS